MLGDIYLISVDECGHMRSADLINCTHMGSTDLIRGLGQTGNDHIVSDTQCETHDYDIAVKTG